jgi:hypothetical protein
MVIDDFDPLGAALAPDKANAPPIVDPDAVLPLAVAFERPRRLPGGARRSASRVAASSMSSLRCATVPIARNAAGVSPRKSASVRLSLNDRITKPRYNAPRYMSIQARPQPSGWWGWCGTTLRRSGAFGSEQCEAEEAGVEPTEDAWRPPTGLKPARPTGSGTLPRPVYPNLRLWRNTMHAPGAEAPPPA